MGTPHAASNRGSTVLAGLVVLAALLIPISSAWSAAGRTSTPTPLAPGADKHYGPKGEIDVNSCAETVAPGTASCFARKRVDSTSQSLTPAPERGRRHQIGKMSSASTQPATNVSVGDNGAYSPLYLQSAYNAPSANAGATVAIVDAYDDSRAESDLAYYRSYFGLPPCTTNNGCFQKVDEHGGTSYPQGSQAWGNEISLDLDMVSAICPNCHILLVEADSNSITDLGAAENEAVALGASVVSNSWGSQEYVGEMDNNAQYFDHPGVAVVASTGDSGYGVAFPAASQYVTAVGGTTLLQATDSGTRDATETAWVGAGSGCSRFVPKPSWQHDTGCAYRTVADVSAVADPDTGVWVWNTYPLGGGWGIFGGTSVAAPIISALYALAGNSAGSSVQMASTVYGDPGHINDVTSGLNGNCGNYLCTAGPGYDGPTGLGTPNGITPFLLSSAPAPSVPAPSSLTAAFGHSIDLSWSAPAGVNVSKYIVERDGTQIATTTNTYYYDDTVSSGGTYSYDVRAVDAAGNVSGPSNVATATVPLSTDTQAPSTPSGVHVAVAGTTQVALYWSPSTDNVGVAGYSVYRDGVPIGQTTAPNFFDTGLIPGTSHVYSVRALDVAGNVSKASSNLNVKTAALSTSTTGTVAGVFYSSAGKPVANVVVTLMGNGLTKSAKTSNTGVYKFGSLPAGAYTLTFATSGTSTAGTTVTAVPGQTVVLIADS